MSSLKGTLNNRKATHGDFVEYSKISQELCNVMYNSSNWATLSDVHKEGLEMIAGKLARILCGDPLYIDSFRDLAGYAQRIQETLMTTEGATDAVVTKKLYHAGQWTEENNDEPV